MHKKTILLSIFALGFAFLSCQKEEDEQPPAADKKIVAVFQTAQFAANTCAELPGLRSFSGPATTVYFKNEADKNLRIYWINQSGAKVVYQQSLEPGSGRLQPTFLTHPWYIVTADEAEECISIVTALRPAVTDTVYFRLQ